MEQWVLDLLGSGWVYVALYLLATLDGFFPPVPSESAVIALATAAIATGEPSLWLVVVAAAAGAFTGDQVAYLIGRRSRLRELRVLRGERAQRAVDRAERALHHRGASLLIAARYVPVGRVAVNMTAGAVHFPRHRFLPITALGGVLWAVYSSLIGVGVGAWLGDQPVLAVVVGVAGGVLIGLAVDAATRLGRRRAGTDGRGPAAPTTPGQDAARREPVTDESQDVNDPGPLGNDPVSVGAASPDRA